MCVILAIWMPTLVFHDNICSGRSMSNNSSAWIWGTVTSFWYPCNYRWMKTNVVMYVQVETDPHLFWLSSTQFVFLGDGAVMDLHPTFTYRTCPTLAEISFVLAALVSVGSILLPDLMMVVGSIGIADCDKDIIHHCINEPGMLAPFFIQRSCSCLCRIVNEIGRLICTRQFWNFCTQFELTSRSWKKLKV